LFKQRGNASSQSPSEAQGVVPTPISELDVDASHASPLHSVESVQICCTQVVPRFAATQS
jgi:hypothetical protein